METHLEINRLQQVYRRYTEAGLAGSKWSASNPGNWAIQEERNRKLVVLLHRAGFMPLGERQILDVGCGTGEKLAALEAWGAKPKNMFGVDLLPERINAAKRNFPAISFQAVNAEALPFQNGSFDLVLAFTVFTSILDQEMRFNVSHEIQRVLRPGGAIIWYDLRINNPANPQVRGITRGQLHHLFPHFESTLASITLLPPLARRLGRFTRQLYPVLGSLPFLRSHYLGALLKTVPRQWQPLNLHN